MTAVAIWLTLGIISLVVNVFWVGTDQERDHTSPFQALGIIVAVAAMGAGVFTTIQTYEDTKSTTIQITPCAEKP